MARADGERPVDSHRASCLDRRDSAHVLDAPCRTVPAPISDDPGLFHPPPQETTAVKSWRNALFSYFGGFRSAEESKDTMGVSHGASFFFTRRHGERVPRQDIRPNQFTKAS